MASRALFVTQLYTVNLDDTAMLAALESSCRALAKTDTAGLDWCEKANYVGYTSYKSIKNLPERDAAFDELRRFLDDHVKRFALTCGFDPKGRKFKLTDMWVNVMRPGGHHSSHAHPRSIVSGTIFLSMPKGSGALQLEDPRIGLMMAAPERNAQVPEVLQNAVDLYPERGTIHLWESWLRHCVLPHRGEGERISISFNFG
jgi:uncharacterized protein (TIGR02466 family)